MRFLEAGGTEGAEIIILGVPFEGGASYRRGSALSPSAIRRVSQSIESYSTVFQADLRDLPLGDAGDLVLSDRMEEAMTKIAGTIESHLRGGRKVVILGGDHSITVGVITGVRRVYPDIQVVVLDAHSDWRDSYEGSRYSHACTVRRLWELVEGRVWVVGTRSFFGTENLRCYVRLEELPQRLALDRPTYLSIDLDALDPSLCPGVGNPEPGGLSYQQVLQVFRTLQGFKVIGMDIVELHPNYDPSEVSAVVAAKLTQEGILAFWGRRRSG